MCGTFQRGLFSEPVNAGCVKRLLLKDGAVQTIFGLCLDGNAAEHCCSFYINGVSVRSIIYGESCSNSFLQFWRKHPVNDLFI